MINISSLLDLFFLSRGVLAPVYSYALRNLSTRLGWINYWSTDNWEDSWKILWVTCSNEECFFLRVNNFNYLFGMSDQNIKLRKGFLLMLFECAFSLMLIDWMNIHELYWVILEFLCKVAPPSFLHFSMCVIKPFLTCSHLFSSVLTCSISFPFRQLFHLNTDYGLYFALYF